MGSRAKRQPRHLVPAAEIAKLIRRAKVAETKAQGREWAEQHGLAWDSIHRYLTGKRKFLEFTTADRIVVALECPEVWWNELSEWYWPPGDEVPAELNRDAIRRIFE